MNWQTLNDIAQIDQIKQHSHNHPVVIFKHSTRCSISMMAKTRLERTYTPSHIHFYFLDLLQHRPLSAMVAETFNVHHESPQILLIKNGTCTYNESHNGIDMQDIISEATR